MTDLSCPNRATFGQRFARAFRQLGIPFLVLATTPIVLILSRELVLSLATTPAANALTELTSTLLAAAVFEMAGVYGWHLAHYGFSFGDLSRSDRYVLAAPSLAAPFLLLLIALGHDPIVRSVLFVILFGMATFFAGFYSRAMLRRGQG